MSERLSAETIRRMETYGGEWREVTCRKCGKHRVVVEGCHSFACDCDTYDTAGESTITHTTTGPTVRERLISEVRRLRQMLMLASLQGDPDSAWECLSSEIEALSNETGGAEGV